MGTLHDVKAPLFRAFENKCHAVDFASGRFRMGVLGRYRDIEDVSRQDTQEGYGHYIDRCKTHWHFQLGNPIYVLFLSGPEVDLAFLQERMGPFAVRINDPLAFAREIERHFASSGIATFNGVHGGSVTYTKGQAIGDELDSGDRARLSITQKPNAYSHECEYRLYTILNQRPRAQVDGFLYVD